MKVPSRRGMIVILQTSDLQKEIYIRFFDLLRAQFCHRKWRKTLSCVRRCERRKHNLAWILTKLLVNNEISEETEESQMTLHLWFFVRESVPSSSLLNFKRGNFKRRHPIVFFCSFLCRLTDVSKFGQQIFSQTDFSSKGSGKSREEFVVSVRVSLTNSHPQRTNCSLTELLSNWTVLSPRKFLTCCRFVSCYVSFSQCLSWVIDNTNSRQPTNAILLEFPFKTWFDAPSVKRQNTFPRSKTYLDNHKR